MSDKSEKRSKKVKYLKFFKPGTTLNANYYQNNPENRNFLEEESKNNFWKAYCDYAETKNDCEIGQIVDKEKGHLPVTVEIMIRIQFSSRSDGEPSSEGDKKSNLDQKINTVSYTLIKVIQKILESKLGVSQLSDLAAFYFLDQRDVINHTTNFDDADDIEENYHLVNIRICFPYIHVSPKLVESYLIEIVKSSIKKKTKFIGKTISGAYFDENPVFIYSDYLPLYKSYNSDSKTRPKFMEIIGNMSDANLEDDDIPDINIDNVIEGAEGPLQKVFCDDIQDHSAIFYLPYICSCDFPIDPVDVTEVDTVQITTNPVKNPFERKESELSEEGKICYTLLRMIKKHHFTFKSFTRSLIGKVLYNLRSGDNRDMEYWIDLCVEGGCNKDECNDEWMVFSINNNYSVRTVAFIAENDNPKVYSDWHRDWFIKALELVIKSKSPLDNDVAKSFYRLFWDKFICADFKNGRWYEFKDHRWIELNGSLDLQGKMVNEFIDAIFHEIGELTKKRKSMADSKSKDEIDAKISSLNVLIANIKTNSKKNSYVREVAIYFNAPFFDNVKNKLSHVTGVKNGVLEINEDQVIFRPGMPDDYITLCCGVPYNPKIKRDSIKVKAIENWYKQMYITEECINYQFKNDSSLLMFGNPEKKVTVNHGPKGNNSKSTRSRFRETTLGTYATKVNPSTLEGMRGGPQPEIAELDGVRLVTIDELDKSTKLRPNMIRIFTGNDEIRARKLHQNGGKFRMGAKVEINTNDLPEIPEGGQSLRQRLLLAGYYSRWNYDAPEDIEKQFKKRFFKMDKNFIDNVYKLCPEHLWLMVEYWPIYYREGLRVPEVYTETTKNYWKTSDVYEYYIDECITKLEIESGKKGIKMLKASKLDKNKLYSNFISWFQKQNLNRTMPSLKDFVENISSHVAFDEKEKVFLGIEIKKRKKNDLVNDDDDSGNERNQGRGDSGITTY